MSASSRTPRPSELMLSIGGVVGHVELRGATPLFVEQLRARYGAFEMPAAPGVHRDFSLELDVGVLPTRPPGSPADIANRPLTVSAKGRTITIDRWDLAVRLAGETAARGRRPSYRGQGRCEMNPFAVDCVLRVVWATLLPRAGGLLIHGCGLRHAEVGFVFPGQSGAGKTTLARKAPDADDVLSDELCVVRRGDDGWRVYGTPFWGDFARGGISMRGWPLRTLAFLTQAPREAVTMTPMLSAEATLRLLGCFMSFSMDRATVEQNLALAVQLCAEVRSVEANLTRSVPAAEIFRKLAPHLGPEVARKVPAANAREMISDFRAFLRKHRTYASQSRGTSMRPWLKPGDSLFIQAVPETELGAGDILLYWNPGPTPNDDLLVCHRLVSRSTGPGGDERYVTKGDSNSRLERFENHKRYEILGKVVAVARDGKTRPMPGRIGNLARLVGSLVTAPLLKMVGR
jgi:hypothetical protein